MIRSAVLAAVGMKLSALEPIHVALVGQVDIGRVIAIVIGLLVGATAIGVVLTCLCADATHGWRQSRGRRAPMPTFDLPAAADAGSEPDATPDTGTHRVPNSRTSEHPTPAAGRR